MKKEELVKKLEEAGINGEWVNPNEYGISRIYQFKLNGQIIEIEWCCNDCKLMIGNMYFWFDRIVSYSEELIGFSFRGERSRYGRGLTITNKQAIHPPPSRLYRHHA